MSKNKEKLNSIAKEIDSETGGESFPNASQTLRKSMDNLMRDMEASFAKDLSEQLIDAVNKNKGVLEKEIKDSTRKEVESIVQSFLGEFRVKLEALRSESKQNYDEIKLLCEGLKEELGSNRELTVGDLFAMQETLESMKAELEGKIVKHSEDFDTKSGKFLQEHDVLKDSVSNFSKGVKGEIEAILGELERHKSSAIETDNKHSKRLDDEILRLEELIKKSLGGLYEYGAMFQVLNNGTLVGITSTVDFIDGTNTTVVTSIHGNSVRVKFNATGGGTGISFESPTSGVIDGSNQAYVFAHTPLYIVVNGVQYFEGHGYSFNSGTMTATFDFAPDTGSWIKSGYSA